MDEKQLLEIEARANAATPGPWEQDEESNDALSIKSHGCVTAMVFGNAFLGEEAQGQNAHFIAHSRTDIPNLIAEIRRLQQDNARLRKIIKGAEWYFEPYTQHEECPWCVIDRNEEDHRDDCPAFTPEGEVK